MSNDPDYINPDWEGHIDNATYKIYVDELFIRPEIEPFTIDLLPKILDRILNECPLNIAEDIKAIYLEF